MRKRTANLSFQTKILCLLSLVWPTPRFDYVRLEEEEGDVERTREVYERAIAQVSTGGPVESRRRRSSCLRRVHLRHYQRLPLIVPLVAVVVGSLGVLGSFKITN